MNLVLILDDVAKSAGRRRGIRCRGCGCCCYCVRLDSIAKGREGKGKEARKARERPSLRPAKGIASDVASSQS